MSESVKSPLPHETLSIDEYIGLRALTPEDANAMYNITEVNRAYLARFLPWVDRTKSKQDSLEFIDKSLQQRIQGEGYAFGITFNDFLVGGTSIMHIKDDKTPEIGYWISEEYSGLGIITKTTIALTNFGFDVLGLKKILIRARLNNTGSNRVAEKARYVFVGVYDDTEGTPHNHWVKEKQATEHNSH